MSIRNADHVIRVVGMTDEVFRPVDDEIVAGRHGRGLHAAQVRARTGLGHGEALRAIAAHGGQQIAFALFAFAGEQDVRRSADASVVKRVARLAELLLVEHPGDGIEAGAADVGGHVGRVQAGIDRHGLESAMQFLREDARLLDFAFVRIQFFLHELARRADDQLLLIRQ
jgi:hypothetical protein